MHVLCNNITTVRIGLHLAFYGLSRRTERLYFFFMRTSNISFIAAEVDNRRQWSATYKAEGLQ